MFKIDYVIDEELIPLRDHLSLLYIKRIIELEVNVTPFVIESINRVVGCFVLNSYNRYKASLNSPNVKYSVNFGITLDTKLYSKPIIENGRDTKRKVSYKFMTRFLGFLERNGYIDLHKGEILEWGFKNGVYQPTSVSQSFVTMNDKLLDIYDQFSAIEYKVPQLKDVIRVKEGDNYVTFRFNDITRLSRGIMDNQNALSLTMKVSSCRGTHDVQGYKIYNGKTYDKNARTYMTSAGVQCLTREERKTIEINDKPVAIFDYKSFEPSIAYSLNGVKMPDDPYGIHLVGYDETTLRSIAKKCLLIMINIKDKSQDSLRSACNDVIFKEFDVQKLHEKGLLPARIDVLKICELLDEKNYHIREYFYGKAPVQLTYIGSLISDYITNYFSQRGILVLSVFDEFIIQEQYSDDLYEVMHDAYEVVCGVNYNCKIVKEK